MEVRYCLEIKFKKKFDTFALYKKIEPFKARLIDIGTHVYVTGAAPYSTFSSVLEACIPFGVVECEVGRPRS